MTTILMLLRKKQTMAKRSDRYEFLRSPPRPKWEKGGWGGGGLSLRSIKRRPIDALKRKYITFHVGIGNILAATVSRSWKKW